MPILASNSNNKSLETLILNNYFGTPQSNYNLWNASIHDQGQSLQTNLTNDISYSLQPQGEKKGKEVCARGTWRNLKDSMPRFLLYPN